MSVDFINSEREKRPGGWRETPATQIERKHATTESGWEKSHPVRLEKTIDGEEKTPETRAKEAIRRKKIVRVLLRKREQRRRVYRTPLKKTALPGEEEGSASGAASQVIQAVARQGLCR